MSESSPHKIALLSFTRAEKKSTEYSGTLIPSLPPALVKTIAAPSEKTSRTKSAPFRKSSDICPCFEVVDDSNLQMQTE